MGDMVRAKVEGAEDLLKELRALGGNVKAALRGSVRAGGNVIKDAAEQNARAVTGSSGKHVRIKVSARNKEFVEAEIGPTKKKFELRFFETGVQPHEISGPLAFEGDKGLVLIGGVSHPGMPAQPWLRPALDSRGGEATSVMGEKLRAAVEQARIEAEGQDDEE